MDFLEAFKDCLEVRNTLLKLRNTLLPSVNPFASWRNPWTSSRNTIILEKYIGSVEGPVYFHMESTDFLRIHRFFLQGYVVFCLENNSFLEESFDFFEDKLIPIRKPWLLLRNPWNSFRNPSISLRNRLMMTPARDPKQWFFSPSGMLDGQLAWGAIWTKKCWFSIVNIDVWARNLAFRLDETRASVTK